LSLVYNHIQYNKGDEIIIKATISKYQFTPTITIRLFVDKEMICIFDIDNDNITKQKYMNYIYVKFDNNHRIYVDKYEIYKEDEIGEMILIETESI